MRHVFLILLLYGGHIHSQTFALKADRLISGDREILSPTIIVYKDKILDIIATGVIPDSAQLIDLSGHTLLPGLIDVHTHLLHDGGDYEKNIYGHSTAFRAIRATSHLDISLKNGFTTLRDVCTEGAGYADVDLELAIQKGIINGPTIVPSTKGIAATGQYMPSPMTQSWDLELPSGSKYVTGVDECRKEVREQISRGAKWIKVFADWKVVSFREQELLAIVDEAKRFNVNIAAHATTREGILLAIKCGVKSIEHGDGFDEVLIQQAIKANVYWCPTMSVYEYYKIPSDEKYKNLKSAYTKGLKIVLGTDIGSFPWTNSQAKELEYYVKLVGMKPIDAIKSGTIYPAQLLDKQKEIGQLASGFIADIIAVRGNPLNDITLLQHVDFVMKDGHIIKR